MFKKVGAGIMAAAIAFSASSCASNAGADQDKPLTIGLSIGIESDFFNQFRQAMEDEAKKEGINLIAFNAKGDPNAQVNHIQDFIVQDADAIIYIAAGAGAAGVPVKNARAADIPVVTVDRNPGDSPGDTFIATDSVASSKRLGEYVIEKTGGKGNLGIIQGQVGTTPELDRDKGFTEAMKSATGIKEVARQASKLWGQEEGFTIAQDMLSAHPELSVIFARADGMALGAAQAVRGAGRDDIQIYGHDGDPAALQAVLDGTLVATMTQQNQHMGRLAIESAVKLARGEEVPKEQLQEAILTTKENAAEFLKTHP
ncbi:substrate-binding domain-containing protein [Pseudarthrobacter oxydans]|uniref:substrate-binding domain-containing protein n=1 Tax=Pseudarthrobacter oxydans TaxID=1671 RepID=UPI003D2DF994